MKLNGLKSLDSRTKEELQLQLLEAFGINPAQVEGLRVVLTGAAIAFANKENLIAEVIPRLGEANLTFGPDLTLKFEVTPYRELEIYEFTKEAYQEASREIREMKRKARQSRYYKDTLDLIGEPFIGKYTIPKVTITVSLPTEKSR